MHKRTARKFDILVVEDNPGDMQLIRLAFQGWATAHQLHFATDGMEAIELVVGTPSVPAKLVPHFILLDLNLPKLDGKEVLRVLKANEKLRHVPVVIFTSSSSEREILGMHGLHANSYVVKPMDVNEYRAAIESIKSYWFSTALLPTWQELNLV